MKIPNNATVRGYVIDALESMTSGKVIAAIAGKELVKTLENTAAGFDTTPLAGIFISLFGAILAAESEQSLFIEILSNVVNSDQLDQRIVASLFSKAENRYHGVIDGVTAHLAMLLQDPNCEFYRNLAAAERFTVLSIIKVRYLMEGEGLSDKPSVEFCKYAFTITDCFENELLEFIETKQAESWRKTGGNQNLN